MTTMKISLRRVAVAILAIALTSSMLVTVATAAGTSPGVMQNDELLIPSPGEDTTSLDPATATDSYDSNGDGNLEFFYFYYERHVRIDRDYDGVFESGRDVIIERLFYDDNDDGIRDYIYDFSMRREFSDNNDDGIREVQVGSRVVREQADWNYDGLLDYLYRASDARALQDRNSDGFPELNRASSYLEEYFNEGEGGVWETTHLMSVGYALFDKNSNGEVDSTKEWNSDVWS